MRRQEQEVREPVEEEEKTMSNSSINFSELLERVENDRELLRDLLLIFKEEFPRLNQALHDAVESREAKRVTAEAHTLKGMLSHLAARQAADAAARLEQLGRKEKTSEFTGALAAFDQVARQLLLQVDSCVAEVPR